MTMNQRNAMEEVMHRLKQVSPDVKDKNTPKSTLGRMWKWAKDYGWIVVPAVVVFYQSSVLRYDGERTILLENVAGRLGIGEDSDSPREVPLELKEFCVNWYFVFKDDVDTVDLSQFAVVIINGFFSCDENFVMKLREAVTERKIGIIFKKNETFSNTMGFTRGGVKHFYNFSKTTCGLNTAVEHPISSKFAFYTMNMKPSTFSYCYYLSPNNLVSESDLIQLDNSAYGYTFAVHHKYPIVYYFFDYEKDRGKFYKFLMLSCLRWISLEVKNKVEKSLIEYQPDPKYEIVETKQKYSNVRFNIEGKILHANKEFLAYKSRYFDALLMGKMQESTQNEVTINDVSFVLFRTVLLFMITGEVKVTVDNCCDILIICDKLGDLEPLRDRCTSFIITRLLEGKETLEEVWHLTKISSLHHCDKVLEVCAYIIVNNQKFFRDRLKTLDKNNPLFFYLSATFLNSPNIGHKKPILANHH